MDADADGTATEPLMDEVTVALTKGATEDDVAELIATLEDAADCTILLLAKLHIVFRRPRIWRGVGRALTNATRKTKRKASFEVENMAK
jgi:hypothetical protein